jgi:cytidylate kinase
MPIITISRGSYYHGRSIAEKLAQRLGYRCISRDQIIENLEEFHLPEIKLVRGLHDTFSVLDRFPHGKTRFTAAVRSAILQEFLDGNVVYHGLVGHYFVRNISHVLKIRIVADMKSRIEDDMTRQNVPEDKARFVLKKDDEERRKWGMFLYGSDVVDPENYNMVIKVGHINEEEAIDLIVKGVSLPSFQETMESRKLLADAALAALVNRTLFDFPHASVAAQSGAVTIALKAPEEQQQTINARIGEMIAPLRGVDSYTVKFEPYF